jgi:hypothetical protein
LIKRKGYHKHIWNGGIQNRGMIGNTGNNCRQSEKTEECKIEETHKKLCLEQRNGNIGLEIRELDKTYVSLY